MRLGKPYTNKSLRARDLAEILDDLPLVPADLREKTGEVVNELLRLGVVRHDQRFIAFPDPAQQSRIIVEYLRSGSHKR